MNIPTKIHNVVDQHERANNGIKWFQNITNICLRIDTWNAPDETYLKKYDETFDDFIHKFRDLEYDRLQHYIVIGFANGEELHVHMHYPQGRIIPPNDMLSIWEGKGRSVVEKKSVFSRHKEPIIFYVAIIALAIAATVAISWE